MNECPTCHRPFGGKHRTCFACGKPILRRHRWHTVGCYNVHDDCSNPVMSLLIRPREVEFSESASEPENSTDLPETEE